MAHLTTAQHTAAWNYNVGQAEAKGADDALEFTGTYPTAEEARLEARRVYTDGNNLSDFANRAYAEVLRSYADESDAIRRRMDALGF